MMHVMMSTLGEPFEIDVRRMAAKYKSHADAAPHGDYHLAYSLTIDSELGPSVTVTTRTLPEMERIGQDILTQVQAIRDYEAELESEAA